MQDVYDKQKAYNWHDEYKSRLLLGKTLRQKVASLSRRFHKKDEISNSELSDFGTMMEEYEYGYAYMMHELMSIVYDNDQ